MFEGLHCKVEPDLDVINTELHWIACGVTFQEMKVL